MKGLIEIYLEDGTVVGHLVDSWKSGLEFLFQHLDNDELIRKTWLNFIKQNDDKVLWPNVIILLKPFRMNAREAGRWFAENNKELLRRLAQ